MVSDFYAEKGPGGGWNDHQRASRLCRRLHVPVLVRAERRCRARECFALCIRERLVYMDCTLELCVWPDHRKTRETAGKAKGFFQLKGIL